MRITWYGHAAFSIAGSTADGNAVKVILDPYNYPDCGGYLPVDDSADVVSVRRPRAQRPRQRQRLAADPRSGRTLVGAFDADILVGFAIYQSDLAEGMANLSALYVSRSYRRKRVGSLLAEELARLARADGARRLYVSVTPSGPAVEFYRSHGFEPIDEPNEALFALEPDDIHMILEL